MDKAQEYKGTIYLKGIKQTQKKIESKNFEDKVRFLLNSKFKDDTIKLLKVAINHLEWLSLLKP